MKETKSEVVLRFHILKIESQIHSNPIFEYIHIYTYMCAICTYVYIHISAYDLTS